MFDACLPFGPCVTSNWTFWPSFRVLNPGMLMAEKCANRSSPPPSGVMKPKPLASLNHLTVPVGMDVFLESVWSPGTRPAGVSISRTSSGRGTACAFALESKTVNIVDDFAPVNRGGKAAPRQRAGSGELGPHLGGPGAEGRELATGDVPGQRDHPAIGARIELVGRDEAQRRADHVRDIVRGLDLLVRNVDRAYQHVLAGQKAEELDRHVRVRALERDLADRRGGEQREGLLVLAPFAAERLLPVV